MATAVDYLACRLKVVSRQRLEQPLAIGVEEGPQQTGGDFRRAGTVRPVSERDVEQRAVALVVVAPRQLHEAAPAIARAVADRLVAQPALVLVGAEWRLTGQCVEARGQFGNRRKALGLGANGPQRHADQAKLGEAEGGQCRRDVGQIGGDARRARKREQLADQCGIDLDGQRRARHAAQHGQAAWPGDAVGHQPDARLPSAQSRLGVGVELVTSGEAGEARGTIAQCRTQSLLEACNFFTRIAAHQHDRFRLRAFHLRASSK